jgi:hypothetical protein
MWLARPIRSSVGFVDTPAPLIASSGDQRGDDALSTSWLRYFGYRHQRRSWKNMRSVFDSIPLGVWNAM